MQQDSDSVWPSLKSGIEEEVVKEVADVIRHGKSGGAWVYSAQKEFGWQKDFGSEYHTKQMAQQKTQQKAY